jgi:RNA polymerase sigma-70 factor (family 1)
MSKNPLNDVKLSHDLNNDNIFLLKIANGDHQAFGIIYKKYNQKIFTFSMRILHSHTLAEEVVQESMLKLWQMGNNLIAINNLDNYLKKIARNCAIDILRRKELEIKGNVNLMSNWKEIHNETEEQIILNDARKVLNDGIALLSTQQKAVYQLCHLEGLKYEEAAGRLNLSTFTVQSYMKLALKFLRNYMMTHTDMVVLLVIFNLF